MTDLFSAATKKQALDAPQPLAERLRPQVLSDVCGQEHLTGETGVLTRLLASEKLPSFILWGPPGTGKTTIARLLAQHTDREFVQISAVFAGVADLRKVFDMAAYKGGIVLFIDEIHRFNKSQQDALLGPIESGLVILIGATTENPSFSLNSALLSRARVLTINPLDDVAMTRMLDRAEAVLEKKMPLTEAARHALIQLAGGDGRMLLNLAETVFEYEDKEPLSAQELGARLQRRMAMYDKDQDFHYNLISALIKSMRGSDVDAALYWMARMLEAGEEPLYLARRLVRFATEDIGLADPQALIHAVACYQTYERLGSPEADLAIANCVAYLATAPKSNAAYKAFNTVMEVARETNQLHPPKHILNAPTKLMKQEGYGAGYQYDHDAPDAFSGQDFLPKQLTQRSFYEPVERGFERDIKKRLEYWAKLREERKGGH